jgi:hypothetical protein
MEQELPKDIQSNTERLEPSRDMPQMETDEPMRTKD